MFEGLIAAGGLIGAVLLTRLTRTYAATFKGLLFVDEEAGDPYRSAPRPVDNVICVLEGDRAPQVVLLSLSRARRRVLFRGRERERLALLGSSGSFLWAWSSRHGLHARDLQTGALLRTEAQKLALPLERRANPEAWTAVNHEATVASGTLSNGQSIDLHSRYLEGRLVYDQQNARVMQLDAPTSVLIAHRDKPEPGARLLISRVALDGECLWTRSESDYRAVRAQYRDVGELAFAASRADGIYLVINRCPYCVLVVDPHSGNVLKRYPR